MKKETIPDYNVSTSELANMINQNVIGTRNVIRDRAMFSCMLIFGLKSSQIGKIEYGKINFSNNKTEVILEIESKRIAVAYYSHLPMFKLFFNYYNLFVPDKNNKLFPIKRIRLFYIIKQYFGEDYFPFWFRKQPIRKNINEKINVKAIGKKFDLKKRMVYYHMNEAQEKQVYSQVKIIL